jgi:exonuclease III
LGDFNSGRNANDIEINVGKSRFAAEFSTADLYAELETHWTEAWSYMHPNEREFSWYPFRNNPPAQRRNGWRIDKAFVSQALLPYFRAAQYDHGFRFGGLNRSFGPHCRRRLQSGEASGQPRRIRAGARSDPAPALARILHGRVLA